MTVKPPTPPPLPDELDRLLRRLRMPYVRRAAPDVIATANSQRWEHAEVLRVLLAEEAAGRDRATINMRRRVSGLPAGKTFDAWKETVSVIPKPTHRRLPHGSSGSTGPKCSWSAARQGPASRSSSSRSGTSRSTKAAPSPGTHSNPRRSVPPPPRRRQHQQGDQQADPLRPHPDRPVPIPRLCRHRRRGRSERREFAGFLAGSAGQLVGIVAGSQGTRGSCLQLAAWLDVSRRDEREGLFL